MPDGFLRPKEVCERLGVSRSTLDRMWQAGRFPAPERISPGRLGYRETKVDRWFDERDEKARKGRARLTSLLFAAGFMMGSGGVPPHAFGL